MRSTLFTAALCAAFALTGCDAYADGSADATSETPVAYAHEANNRATLSGSVTGTAIVNYIAGRSDSQSDSFQSTVNVKGDLPDGTYGFYVAGGPSGAAGVLVCTFEAGQGRLGCSADKDLPGFARAEIRDAGGVVIASGVFARRGGNRDK